MYQLVLILDENEKKPPATSLFIATFAHFLHASDSFVHTFRFRSGPEQKKRKNKKILL